MREAKKTKHGVALTALLLTWSVSVVLANDGMANPPPSDEGMSLLQAAILGVVEGITEYLPVSSTGHLILTQRAMGIDSSSAADAYVICIQAGAILAVLGLYIGHMRRMVCGLLGRDEAGRKLAINIAVSFLPAAVIGYLTVDLVMQYLFSLWAIVFAWFVGGAAILAVAWQRRHHPERGGFSIEALTWKRALVIGLIQCIAIWPGTSRSLVTIVGGYLVGMNLSAAVIYSFLLGAITLAAVTVYEALFHGTAMLEAYGWPALAMGFVVGLVSAAIAVRWMLGYINKHGLAIFGYYRVALALVVAAMILGGILVP